MALGSVASQNGKRGHKKGSLFERVAPFGASNIWIECSSDERRPVWSGEVDSDQGLRHNYGRFHPQTFDNIAKAQARRRTRRGLHARSSPRNERLFGLSGRSSYRSNGIKLEKLGDDYDPRDDSCVKAFVRLLARIAHAAVLAESETDSA